MMTELGDEDLTFDLYVGKPIEMLVRNDSGQYEWRTCIIDRLDDSQESIGIATCWVDGRIQEFEFAWRGFELDPRTRYVDGKEVP